MGLMTVDRERLRSTFDMAADVYQEARREYPQQLYDVLIAAAELSEGDRLLEVGCATGKATIPLARRGFHVTGIELGRALAHAGRRNLKEFPTVRIICSPFETWRPPEPERFDMVFAATAWHWIDPAVRYRRAWEVLRPGGHLAFWGASQVFPDGGDPFFREIQDVYEQIGEGLPADAPWPRPGLLTDQSKEIQASGLFEVTLVRHFDWEVSYDTDAYLRLLDTFSDHIAMDTDRREHLYAQIRRRLSARPDGRLRRQWGAVLHVARRKTG